MNFENKIAIIVKNDLLNWQKLNVASFLASSVAINFPETHGKPFINASQSEYLPFIKQPILIYKADDQPQMDRVFSRAKERNLSIGIYPYSLFSTKNEEQNHLEMSKLTDDCSSLVGIVIYGENKKVNKALDGLMFHS
ncbi:DUF2000 family protein [Reichenbachiella sp.]|uniref:DUF2000 family protein n=1 Tax=Reichenbachiella sp. TaxID=2184521 RepID=UPI003BB17195